MDAPQLYDRVVASGVTMQTDRIAAIGRFHRQVAAALYERLRMAPGILVLDIGCGQANEAQWLNATSGVEVMGVDLTDSTAGERCFVPRVCADAAQLPIASHTFDAAYSINLVQLLPSRAAVFHEVQRVLKPRGLFALQVPTVKELQSRPINPFFPSLFEVDKARFPRIATVRRELRSSGFIVLGRFTVECEPHRLDRNYVDRVKSTVSGLAHLPPYELAIGLEKLQRRVDALERKSRRRFIRRTRSFIVVGR